MKNSLLSPDLVLVFVCGNLDAFLFSVQTGRGSRPL